ncbi:MAG TPA: DUF362 domain-containing protein [Acidobacteriota bacterium]|nr:DUF362 domain-containing protein [Acidobacteriota bacterium]
MNRRALRRRDFLKFGAGAVGGAALGGVLGAGRPFFGRPAPLAAGPLPLAGPIGAAAGSARVALIKGTNRYEMILQSLRLLEDEVLASIGTKRVLIKPNMVLSNCAACDTHVDAVRAVLDFLAPHAKNRILIGESGVQDTMKAFLYNGYGELAKSYNVTLVDLNRDTWRTRYVLGLDNKPTPLRIINTFFDPDLYIISVARMKTHNYVFVTLSIKNVIMASPVNDAKGNDKGLMHQAPPAKNDLLHYNMFHIAQEIFPDLAVIDGYVGIEGNGPAWGVPIGSKVAVASLDAVAADVTGTRVMGFDPGMINYLNAMSAAGLGQGDPARIRLLGTPIEQCITKYKPNERMAELYKL